VAPLKFILGTWYFVSILLLPVYKFSIPCQ